MFLRPLTFVILLSHFLNIAHPFLLRQSLTLSTILMASPSSFEQKLSYNVDRFAKILMDEDEEEGTPLVDWLKDAYGPDKTLALHATHFTALDPPQQRQQLQQLLQWFRQMFPYYRDECEHCHAKKCQFIANEPPTNEELQYSPYIDTTEVSKCGKCQKLCRFPRYLAAMQVIRRKQGRCSEYSLLLYRILRALGHSSRWIVDWANHVWVELWMNDRWVHLDPCEAAIGTPYMYQGWGKKQTYIVAFEAKSDPALLCVVDVTKEYTKDTLDDILQRRKDDGATQEDIVASLERANGDLKQLSLLELIEKHRQTS